MAKQDTSKPNSQADQQSPAQQSQPASTQQSQQSPSQQSPAHTYQQPPTQQSQEANQLLAILTDLFSTVQRQPPNANGNRKALQDAVDGFNVILGGLELKPPSSIQGADPVQSSPPNQAKGG